MAKKKDKKAFPLLNTEEAEEVVHELGRALDAHRDWTNRFRKMLVCRTKPKASDLNVDAHKKTAFGRWYYGKVHPHLRDHPDFRAIGKHHEHLHGLARILSHTIRDKEDVGIAQYDAFVESIGCFRLSVRKLLSESWDMLRHTDPLTGVLTRTAMQARFEDEQERARRNGQPCCVGMMDLDHFKSINDTYGHQAGDKVLEVVAGYTLGHLRNYDQVFRYGGEEFVLLFPNTAIDKAKTVLDRLRRGLKRKAIAVGKKKNLHVSASFGVADLLPDCPAKMSLENADQALYAAKKAGRNRVLIWPLA